jgi:hypothetical protein
LGIHQKTTELTLLGPSAKPVYSLANLCEMGIMSRTQAYVENREGRLVFRKIGRKTIVLHEDLVNWLQNLPLKNAISEAHKERALLRWAKQHDRITG